MKAERAEVSGEETLSFNLINGGSCVTRAFSVGDLPCLVVGQRSSGYCVTK